ncbi:glutamate racemase [Endozoicomonas sp. Mp262]|uniref:glutamate racemase n=1 Tax=Endozoicomonas sp. Mp262 TaxID=2919499 RepID=UPI0021D9D580
MQKQTQPIIIFDSGVGGLTIYQEVKQMLPSLKVIYCSDSAGFPYGSRSESEVVDRTCHYLAELTRRYDPSLVVIACNTASTVSLPRVRQILDIPVVGVVPAIKTASERSEKRCIGLLATPGTVRREYTDQLIHDFASDCQVIRVGSSELVHLAEQYLRGESIAQEVLKAIVAPFFAGKLRPDVIVLGCTHFPLLRDLLQSVVPCPVDWVDSGAAIARRVSYLLGMAPEEKAGAIRDIFIHTGELSDNGKIAPALETMGFARLISFDYQGALI